MLTLCNKDMQKESYLKQLKKIKLALKNNYNLFKKKT